MTEVAIRHAQLSDLPAMTRLYNHFVKTSAVTFDTRLFTVEEREPWLAQFSKTGRRQLFVAEIGGRFAGYAGSVAHRAKPAYETSVETTIYVDGDYGRLGVGRALYARLFEALSVEDVRGVFAGVALPNDASVRFHLSCGYSEIGVFHEVGRKFGRYHDVLWLEKQL